jgi:putative heme-binding domain-containing protein
METDSVSANQKAMYLSEDISKRSEKYGKAVQEMLSNMPNPQNISYALSLSELQEGWTPELRKRYFDWFNKALKKTGGRSYTQFIRTIQENALKNVPFEDRQYFEALASEAFDEANDIMKDVIQPKGPGQNWTVDKVIEAYASNIKGVNHKSGENLFKASLCASCHSVNGLGRNTGPELTRVGTRFSLTDLATAIVNPSATISDRYQFTEFHLIDDRVVAGSVIKENNDSYILSTNAFSPELETNIKKKNILSQNDAQYSSMPPGLINRLNEKELSDLIAYLMTGGDEENKIYKKSNL